MESNEDLELQELALNKRVSKRQKTLEEKRMIVRAHLLNHVPISQLSANFGVDKVTIWRWIRTFADGKVPDGRNQRTPDVKPNPSSMSKKSQKPVETEAEELARLREENKRLAEALKMSEWMNHAKDVMIDEAEKMFNIPIRKNLVPNSEDACRREGQGPDHGPSLPAVWQELAGVLPAQGDVRQATIDGGDGCPVCQGDTAAGPWHGRREASLHVSRAFWSRL